MDIVLLTLLTSIAICTIDVICHRLFSDKSENINYWD